MSTIVIVKDSIYTGTLRNLSLLVLLLVTVVLVK